VHPELQHDEHDVGSGTTSVVIVSYKTRDLLLACVESVYASEGVPEPQIIVVDNASSDGSPKAVRDAFPRCVVIENAENMGFSKANNIGIARATGDYVLLLNPDTVLQPDVLADMTEYMEKHRDVGMATCKLVTGDGSLDLACRRSFPSLWDGFCRAAGLSALFPRSRLFARYNLTYFDESETREVDCINGAFMFVRREAMNDVGLLDEDYFIYSEDVDWCYRFWKKRWKVVYHPTTTTLHLKGQSGNPIARTMIPLNFRSMETFCRKHYFPRLGLVRRLMLLAGLRAWKWLTIARNALRRRKRTRP